MVKRWFEALFVIFLLLFSGSAAFGAGAGDKGAAGRVLVEMKDGSITLEEFRQKVDRMAELSGMKADLLKDSEGILQEIIRTKLFVLEARRQKMDERSDIAGEIQDAVERVLADHYLKEQVFSKIRVTDEDIKAYIEKKPSLFNVPETVGVRRILIRVRKDATPEVVEAARKKAEEAIVRVKAGEDFVKLAEAYSGDKKTGDKKTRDKKTRDKKTRDDKTGDDKTGDDKTGDDKTGDIGYLKKGGDKEFDDIVFGLKIGEVSPVIRTSDGFVIVKVEDKRPERSMTMKEVRPSVTSILMSEKENALTEALVKELTEKYGVKIHKELMQ